LYVASVLTENNNVFPIAFMIAAGDEKQKSWAQMLTYLKGACPIVSQQGRRQVMVDHDDALVRETSLAFVYGRDKGLKEAVKQVFPVNLEFRCAQHIQSNVTERFGINASQFIMAIAKTYRTQYV
jgi:hypothetical protein